MKYFQLALFLVLFYPEGRGQSAGDTTGIARTYSLGEVLVSASTGRLSVSSADIRKFHSYSAGSSVKMLPSVVLSSFGSRNESTVYIHGFDTRSIPVFIDGIPVYVPYDGYVDLSRFTTFDISRIDVSKGFSPVAYGPNAAGGAINLVSMKPVNRFELEAMTGTMSGRGYVASVNAGSNLGKYYMQTGLSMTGKKYFPLPSSFDTSRYEKDRRRDNSASEDARISFRAGYIPVMGDEYSLNYSYSHGRKGNPVYLGNDKNTKARFWKWPYWDKQSVYYISRTALGPGSVIKARIYFDQFKNKLSSFDDQTYSSQVKKSSFDSYYNDNTFGGISEFSAHLTERNHIIVSAHIKNDNHRESTGTIPVNRFSDNTITAGVDDYHEAGRLNITSGLSYNSRISLRSQSYDSDSRSYNDFPGNRSHSVNAQTAVQYEFSKAADISFSMAWKSRFATMKDRYSYRLGTGIPNPDLRPENVLNLELSSSMLIGKNIELSPEIFMSSFYSTIQLVSNVQDGLSQMQNTGHSVFKGIDLTMKYNVFSFLKLYGTYSYIRMKNLSNPDILFTNVPRNKFFMSAEVIAWKIMEANLSAEYSTGSFSATDASRYSPGYFLLNSGFTVHVLNSMDAEAGVGNIFDRNYTLEEGYPEPGRNFYLSVVYRYGKTRRTP